MNRPVPSRVAMSLLAGLLVVLAWPALAQFEDIETHWVRLNGLPQATLGLDINGVNETVRVQGASSTHDYLSLVPTLGLATQGSIYHPDLVSFDVNGDGGLGWTHDSIRSESFSQTRDETQDLIRYLAQVRFLQQKPYNALFFASQDHTFNNYDFYTTARVNSTRYGGRVAWNTPTLSLTADAGYREESWKGMLSPPTPVPGGFTNTSDLAETYFNFNGIHKREHGRSTLTMHYNELANQLNQGNTRNSTSYSVGASDSETFGSRRQITAATGASYGEAEFSSQRTETITANEFVTANLRPKLDSYLSVNYSHTSLRPISSDVVQATAGLRHRLFDSLTTTFDVHGVHDENSSIVTSAHNDRYGAGLREDYTKHLSDWGRLSIGVGAVADHEEHVASGTILATVGESHQLQTNRPVYLNHPRVIVSTIQVLTTNSAVAQENTDYTVVQVGELTEIRRVIGSVLLRDGDTVLVNYESESLFNASFETFSGNVQVRLDLFNLFGIYGRVNWVDNNAPLDVPTETLTDLVGGMDFTWRWARAGAEYEDFDSNFNQYQAWRFFQSGNFRPSDASTLSAEFSQAFYRFGDGRHETQYQFTSRYNSQLTSWLSSYVEAGYSMQDILGTEQDLFAARLGLNVVQGRLTAKAGYQYNYQLTRPGQTEETRERNYFFVQLKRTF